MKGKPSAQAGQTRRLAFVVKTNMGGFWILPQVVEALNRGLEVTVIIPDGEGRLRAKVDALIAENRRLSVRPVAFDFSFGPRLATLRGLREVRRAVRQSRADTVFYHLYASALAVRFSTVGLRLRKVHMVPGPLYLENRFISLIERILWRMDDHIIGGSEYTRRKYRALGVPQGRTSAVPYGVDLAYLDRNAVMSRVQARESLGIPADAFVAVMVAYVYAPKSLVFPGVGIKGHELLLDAWKSFHTEHENARLVFLGSGFGDEGERHRASLIERSEKLGLAESITWLETVEDVRAVYAAADVSVSPSLSENHGAVAEASAMSVPCLVSDAGALPEGVNLASGWVFPSGNRRKLGEALTAAYNAWATGEMPTRGALARQLMQDEFERALCVGRVLDIVAGPKTS